MSFKTLIIKQNVKLLSIAVFLFGIMLPFQNCSEGFKSLPASTLELSSLLLDSRLPIATDGSKGIFVCNPNNIRTNSILKLSNREFSITLSNLLNDFSDSPTSALSDDPVFKNLMNTLPNDIGLSQFAFEENSFLISPTIVSSLFEVTYRAAVLMSSANAGLLNYPNTANCLGNATITQACHQSLVRELAGRAFRRTVSAAESNLLASSIWNASLAKSELLIETFATIASYPDFIYKAYNTGIDDATLATAVNISGIEQANKLSYFLTGSPATSALRTIASSGGLDNPVIFKTEVDRMMTSNAGKANLQRLFREAYGYDVSSDLQYNANFLNGFSTLNLKEAMVQEMDYFFVDEIISKKSRFQDLMTSKNSLVSNSALGQIYGVTANASVGTTLTADRPGFLTRAAFLTKKSGFYTSPVKRGRYVLERVLCDTINDPPPNVPTMVSEVQNLNQLASTRSRYENLTQQPNTSCTACHSRMNPYGFALEGFDSLGRKRSVESIFNTATGQILGSVPVDTSTSIKLNTQGATTNVIDVRDVSLGLASSDMALMCFAKHLKSFDSRQPASAQDSCHMNDALNVLNGINGNQGTVYDAIIAYVSSKSFRTWKY